MPRTVTSIVYRFEELDDKAKEKAREWWRRASEDDTWWDGVYEDAVQVAAILGITTAKEGISFSGFWSQGDGASFVGGYSPKADALDKIKAYAPQDETLHELAERLTALQVATRLRYTDALHAGISRRGRGCHSHTMDVNVYAMPLGAYAYGGDSREEVTPEEASDLTDILREFADWIYRQLEKEYDYLTSDEQVDEMLIGNEYEFTEEGELA